MTQWREFDIEHLGLIPRVPGVYVVFMAGKVVYVGQSADVRVRIREHRIRYGFSSNILTPWGNVSQGEGLYIKVKFSRVLGDWAMWEIRLIARLQPPGNRNYVRARVA